MLRLNLLISAIAFRKFKRDNFKINTATSKIYN